MKHIYKLSSILAITTVISTSAYAAAGGLASGNWVNKYFVDFDNDFPTPATGTASGKPTLVEAVTAKRYPTGHAKEGQGYVERKSVTAGKALKTDANGNLDVQIDGTTIKYDSTNDRLYADVSFADKDDGISANTSGVVNRFATSSTPAATTAKTANITAGTFTLEKGARVTVQFTYAHTGSTVPTLNINGTGAKAIYYNGAQLTNDNAKKLIKGVVDFVYDGTRWNLLGYHENDTTIADTNTTYADGNGITISGTNNRIDVNPDTERAIHIINDKVATKIDTNTMEYIQDPDSPTDTTKKVLKAKIQTYTPGTNVQISSGNVISATDTKYNSGTATSVTDNGPINVLYDNSTIKVNGNNQLYAVMPTIYADKDDGVTAASGVTNRYAECSTAAGTAAKTANIEAGTLTLEKGTRVTVKFVNGNTADNPTININGTGAKTIYYKGVQITTGPEKYWLKGAVDLVYRTTAWELTTTNTTYTAATNAPVDVVQPTDPALPGTIDIKYDGTTIKKNSNNQLYAVIPTQTDYTHTGAEGIEIDASRNVRVDVPKTVSGSTTTYTGGLDFSGTGNSALLKVKPNAAKAIVVENAGVGVNSGNGLQVSSNKLVVKPSTAIDVSSNGVAVKYDNSTIKVNGSGQLYAVGDGNTTDIEGGIATSVTDTNADGQKEVNVLYDTDLTVSSNKLTHANSITAGTAGSTTATSGDSISIPYVTYDNHGHITASGTRTHTVSVTDKDDGVTAASGVTNRYAVSSTGATTATKTATITAGTFNLESGARVTVKFNSINSANNPQLNINGTGAKPIYYRGAAITTGDNKYWIGGVLDFVYDGSTAYHLVDVNTRYAAATNAPLTFVQPTAASLTGTIDVKIDGTTITKNANNQLQAAGDGNQELRCPDGWVNMANKCMFVLGDTNNQNLANTVLTEFDASAINVNPTSTLPSVPTAPSGNTYADGNS